MGFHDGQIALAHTTFGGLYLGELEWTLNPGFPGVLAVVVSLQAWLISKSRMGALGVAIYWLGLATVSNFVPLNRIVADRFYYVPLAGVATQMLAVL